MTTTENISTSKSANKAADYIALARHYMSEAAEMAEVTSNFFVEKISSEITKYAKRAISADCEYTAYANCHAAEVWFSKIDEQF